MKRLILALSLATVSHAAPQRDVSSTEVDARSAARMVVESRMQDGIRWWTVRVHQVPLDQFLYLLGQRAGLSIEGVKRLDVRALVTVNLTERPLEHVLEFTLGSVGLNYSLRRDTIEILAPGEDPNSAAEAMTRASLAWLSATTRFPDHPSAPVARLAQGEIAELRGDLTTAEQLYLSIPADYPESLSAIEATMRGGRVLARLGRWSEASGQFRSLTRDPDAAEFHAGARLEIARASVNLGDPQSALYLLESLDDDYPTTSPLESTARLLVRAMALNGMGRFMEAMRELDAAGPDLDPLGGAEAFLVRAEALEGLKLDIEAGQAWIHYSREVSGPERTRALREAARLALDGGDEMGALFVWREADRLGLGAELEDLRQEARRRLGLIEDTTPDEVATSDRIGLAESWLDQGDLERAAPVFESLYLGRSALTPEAAVRVVIGWARCVEPRQGLASAVRLLAEARPAAPAIELKARLDVAAAGLFEKYERFDEAIDAYRGRY